MPRLYRRYIGASLSPSQAAASGRVGGAIAGAQGLQRLERERRGKLLAQAVAEGKLDVKSLGPGDFDLAGRHMATAKRRAANLGGGVGGFVSGGLGLLGNLGSDIYEAGKGFVPGAVETGKAMVSDLFRSGGNPILMGGRVASNKDSAIREDIVDPTVEQYKYMYLGEGAEDKSLWERMYEHPLQPLLDVATVASLGAGGAARAGVAPGLTRTTGRAPIDVGEGAEIPRAYSQRPLRKGTQILADAAARRIRPLADFQVRRATREMQRMESARQRAGESSAVRFHIAPLVSSRKDLSQREAIALDYSLRGWNTPEKIQASREMFAASLRGENPEGSNIQDFEKIFDTPEDARKFVQYKANLPKEDEALILNPSDRMILAAEDTRIAAEEGKAEFGIPEEEWQAAVNRPQEILDEFMRRREGPEEPGPEAPPEGPPPPPTQPVGPEGQPPSPGIPSLEKTREQKALYDLRLQMEGDARRAGEEEGSWENSFEWQELTRRIQENREIIDQWPEGVWQSMYHQVADEDFQNLPPEEQDRLRRIAGEIFGKEEGMVGPSDVMDEGDGLGVPGRTADDTLGSGPNAAVEYLTQAYGSNLENMAWGDDFGDAILDVSHRLGLDSRVDEVQELLNEIGESTGDKLDADGYALRDPLDPESSSNPPTAIEFVEYVQQSMDELGVSSRETIPEVPNTPEALLAQMGEGTAPDERGMFNLWEDFARTEQDPNTLFNETNEPLKGEGPMGLSEQEGGTFGFDTTPATRAIAQILRDWKPEIFNEFDDAADYFFQIEDDFSEMIDGGFSFGSWEEFTQAVKDKAEELGISPREYSESPEAPDPDSESIWDEFNRTSEPDDAIPYQPGETPDEQQAMDDIREGAYEDVDEGITFRDWLEQKGYTENIVDEWNEGDYDRVLEEFEQEVGREATTDEVFPMSEQMMQELRDALGPPPEGLPEDALAAALDENPDLAPEDLTEMMRGGEPPEGPVRPVDQGPGEPPSQYPIEPTYTPNIAARDFREHRPNLLARFMGGKPEQEFLRGRRDRRLSPSGITNINMLSGPPEGYPGFGSRGSDEMLMAGAARMDPSSFVEHVARRERDIISKAFDQRLLQQVAARDPESGEPTRFKNNREVERALGPDWVLVNDQFPIRWFASEHEFLRDTINKLQEMEDMGLAVTDDNVTSQLENLADQHAQEFVRTAFGAKKIDGVAVPRDFFEYQKRIVTASDPFDNAFMRGFTRYIHKWRTYTLAYMPRWALNTAIGSFLLNMVKGVDPRHYIAARRLHNQGYFADPESAGVNLGNITGLDYLEPGMQGATSRYTGVDQTKMGERIVEWVQRVEDHFRRASFIQSLDRVGKQRMQEMGTIISNVERRRTSTLDEDYITDLLNDPDAVRAALTDLDNFSYNFASLGPYERRYVRQFVPFWGWYKFVSKLVYRLPVDYPGRTNLLANLGFIGNMSNEEYGVMPEWLRGMIPLGMDKGNLEYMSTMGVNPFSQFVNPAGPEGPIMGTIRPSQFSPPIQALMSAVGYDTLRGGNVPISPESGVGFDFFGSPININTGRETQLGFEGAGRRFGMGFLRSVPQFRMVEEGLAGGRPVFPESIPGISERAMPVRPGTERPTTLNDIALQMFGLAPKHFDLKAYQKLLPERVEYVESRNETQRRRLRKSNRRNP